MERSASLPGAGPAHQCRDTALQFTGHKFKSHPGKPGRLIEILNKIKQKYTDKNIDLIGHSLAGAITETSGDDPQVKNVITLNKAINTF